MTLNSLLWIDKDFRLVNRVIVAIESILLLLISSDWSWELQFSTLWWMFVSRLLLSERLWSSLKALKISTGSYLRKLEFRLSTLSFSSCRISLGRNRSRLSYDNINIIPIDLVTAPL